jgi:hypothetical protein
MRGLRQTLSVRLLQQHIKKMYFLLQCNMTKLTSLYCRIIVFITGETPMKCINMIFAIALALLASLLPAQAQNRGAPSTPAAPSQDQCQAEVLKFEQVMSFIRESQGKQAAAKLKEKLLPAKMESEILTKDGYCGLARHLREKKLS